MTWSHPWWFFSLARYNPGGPTYYAEDTRMVADAYLQRSVMAIIGTAATFMTVLVLILPIIRHRIHSLIAAVNSIGIGVAISLCLISPEWLTGYAVIQSPMNYYSPKVYWMEMRVHVGLASINVTLHNVLQPITLTHRNITVVPKPDDDIFFYNERIRMFKPEQLEPSMEQALSHGMPIPLLSVIHFLTSAQLGFGWSHDIMEAGYHCYCTLTFALGTWFLAILFVASIPRYSCYTFILTGVLMITNSVMYFYWVQVELHFPPIFISGEFLELKYGVCFWACFVTGVWASIYGFALSVYDRLHPDKFLTIFDIDYDHKHALATAHRLNNRPASQFEGVELSYQHEDRLRFE